MARLSTVMGRKMPCIWICALAACMALATAQQSSAASSAASANPAAAASTPPSTTSQALVNGTDILNLPDCSDMPISVSQLDLATQADIILTGITLAAGPGAGSCDSSTGALNIALDNSTDPQTNFIVMGVQCVQKGLVSCRSNAEDTKDCLILFAAPSMKDAAPCSLAQGERYQVYLQNQTNGCDGYYLTMYERIFHSVRRPLGGTGCTFYPCFPDPNDMMTRLNTTCPAPVACAQDACDPTISKSPCANDTSVVCNLKTCPGKWMYQNAILPNDTCFELYNYKTSGLPTNCYGRRYVNNRIRELASNDLLANGTIANGTLANGTFTNGINGINGSLANGTVTNGVLTNGIPTNGNLTNGTLTNSVLTYGTLTNGTLTNGTLTNGTLTNGTLTNGVLTNAIGTKGASTNGIPTSTDGTFMNAILTNGADALAATPVDSELSTSSDEALITPVDDGSASLNASSLSSLAKKLAQQHSSATGQAKPAT